MTYFLLYVTANEQDHRTDYYNLAAMLRFKPGVEEINLFIVVSDVDDSFEHEEAFIKNVSRLFKRSRHIRLRSILKKGNIGRDLSSVKLGLDEISQHAESDDLVMIRNRSAIGPLQNNWYASFKHLLHSNPNVGLVGNTINLYYHEEVDPDQYAPHVQTYVYLSTFKILDVLRRDFPAVNETDRLKIICEGEIKISQRIMEMGHAIVSLYWPNELFDLKRSDDETLPKSDIKEEVKGVPFIHRHGLKGIMRQRFDFFGWLYTNVLKSINAHQKNMEIKKIDLFYE